MLKVLVCCVLFLKLIKPSGVVIKNVWHVIPLFCYFAVVVVVNAA